MLLMLSVLADQIDPKAGTITPLGWAIAIGINLAIVVGALGGIVAAAA